MNATPHDAPALGICDEVPGPGEQLREAREAANLSIHEIAANLHLNSKTIRALEADDYENLPAPTFVRGYLRGYARLLDLAPRPIIEAFEHQGIAPPPLVPDIAEKPQARSTDLSVRMVTYLVTAVLLVLVVLWWRTHRPDPVTIAEPAAATNTGALAAGDEGEPEAAGPAAAASAESTVEPGDATPAGVELAASVPGEEGAMAVAPSMDVETEQASASSAMEPTTSDLDSAARRQPAAEAAESTVVTRDEVMNEDEAPPAEQSGEASALLDSRESAAEGGDEPGGAEPQPVPFGLDRLVMRLAAESWLEVYDRDGERLHYDLVAGGRVLVLDGRGPLRVVLGNARHSQVEFNGVLFDYEPFASNGVARFTLGEP